MNVPTSAILGINSLLGVEFLGAPLVHGQSFAQTVVLFALDCAAVSAVVFGIYRRSKGTNELVFTMVALNIVIFLLTQLMIGVDISAGIGFGLFALFGMIRYRTDGLSPREMTYVFACVALAVANGLGSGLAWADVVLTDVVLVGTIWMLERAWAPRQLADAALTYERIELTHPDRRDELIADLRERTGLDIRDVRVSGRSFLNDTARVRIYYEELSATGVDRTRRPAIDLRNDAPANGTVVAEAPRD